MRTRGVGVVAALLMVLAACSTGDPAVDDASMPEAETTAPSTTEPSYDTDSVAAAVEALTTPRDEGEIHRRYEEAKAVCMRERGFEYTPRPHVAPLSGAMGSALVPLEDRRAFMEEFGYGLTTLYWEAEREMLENTGVDNDPNEARIAAMSDAEREAYQDAMLGSRTGETQAGTEGGEWAERRDDGCHHEGLEAYRGFDRDALSDRTQRALDEVFERVSADEAVVDVTEAWYRCMVEAGYPMDDVFHARGDRRSFISGEELAYGLADQLNYGATAWRDVEILYGDGSVYVTQLPEFDPDELATAQAEELRIAAADLACEDETERSATVIAARDRIYEEVVADNLTDFLEVLSD